MFFKQVYNILHNQNTIIKWSNICSNSRCYTLVLIIIENVIVFYYKFQKFSLIDIYIYIYIYWETIDKIYYPYIRYIGLNHLHTKINWCINLIYILKKIIFKFYHVSTQKRKKKKKKNPPLQVKLLPRLYKSLRSCFTSSLR